MHLILCNSISHYDLQCSTTQMPKTMIKYFIHHQELEIHACVDMDDH